MKKVVWGQPKLTSAKFTGKYGSYAELVKKANVMREQQEAAEAYLAKARPAMAKLLEIRMTNKEPITVVRPLRYQTSVLDSELRDEIDDSFYNTRKSQSLGKYVDVIKVIDPGTQLIFKSLDPHLQEFIFEDATGKEHAISFAERNALMTQTDIYETVKLLFENKGE